MIENGRMMRNVALFKDWDFTIFFLWCFIYGNFKGGKYFPHRHSFFASFKGSNMFLAHSFSRGKMKLLKSIWDLGVPTFESNIHGCPKMCPNRLGFNNIQPIKWGLTGCFWFEGAKQHLTWLFHRAKKWGQPLSFFFEGVGVWATWDHHHRKVKGQ